MTSLSGVVYVGVTNDLARRVWEHKADTVSGFSKRYKCHRLVWYEGHADIRLAIAREKEIEAWRRTKKDALTRDMNPAWRDLSQDLNT